MFNIGAAFAKPYQSRHNAYRCFRAINKAQRADAIKLELMNIMDIKREPSGSLGKILFSLFSQYLDQKRPFDVLDVSNKLPERNCTKCAQQYFHSPLYNIPILIHCPLHSDELLSERCPACGNTWFHNYDNPKKKHCGLCGINLSPHIPKQDEIDAIRQKLHVVVAWTNELNSKWIYEDRHFNGFIDSLAAPSPRAILIRSDLWLKEPKNSFFFKDFQPSLLSFFHPEYEESIQSTCITCPIKELVFPTQPISLEKKLEFFAENQSFSRTSRQLVRPKWLEDSVNRAFKTMSTFIASTGLCACHKSTTSGECIICSELSQLREFVNQDREYNFNTNRFDAPYPYSYVVVEPEGQSSYWQIRHIPDEFQQLLFEQQLVCHIFSYCKFRLTTNIHKCFPFTTTRDFLATDSDSEFYFWLDKSANLHILYPHYLQGWQSQPQ